MSRSRTRIVFAAGATAVLAAAIVVVAVSGSSDDGAVEDECLAAWNDDAVARSDGVHAYDEHGYRATLVARIGPRGESVAAAPASADTEPSPDSRCAVIFAAPRVDEEPDFGVRVLDRGRWAGLALVDRVPLERIEALQQEATESANVTLLPDGRLAD